MKIYLYLILLLLSFSVVSAATIYGNVYDISLEKMDKVKVEIDTEPKQSYIVKNGSYAFEVPAGQYILRAAQLKDGEVESSVVEAITVNAEGKFVLDLISELC
jgi:uncharacterized membrane protein